MILNSALAIGLFLAGSLITFAASYIATRIQITSMFERQNADHEDIGELKTTVYGNGREGVKTQVTRVEDRVAVIEKVVDALPCRLPAPNCPR